MGTSPAKDFSAIGGDDVGRGGSIGGRSGREIGWSSPRVRDAANDLEKGHATHVTVGTRDEAAEIFLRQYYGQGYLDRTGFFATDFTEKRGTYHWDGPSEEFPRAHLQIHTFEGPIIRIFYGD
jgi:hypothetical protein